MFVFFKIGNKIVFDVSQLGFGLRTCILCIDIPDSLKTIGRFVTFSGELKESCNKPKPELRGQEIYFVYVTILK